VNVAITAENRGNTRRKAGLIKSARLQDVQQQSRDLYGGVLDHLSHFLPTSSAARSLANSTAASLSFIGARAQRGP
jgi:hypothetical protein